MEILKEFALDGTCSYLDNLHTNTHYKIIDKCSINGCSELIERGYRRFGKMFFRPMCHSCNECQSIKIDVDNFTFSKSQRRVLKKGRDLQIYIQPPTISKEHLKLFDKYHFFMKDKKG